MTMFASEAQFDWAPLFLTWARVSAAGLDVRFADGMTWRLPLAELIRRIGGEPAGVALDEAAQTVVVRRTDRRQVPLPWDGLRYLADAGYRKQMQLADAQANRTVGARIRAWRQAVGWTQAQLALASGLSRITLSRLETGHQEPTLATTRALSSALGISSGELTALAPGAR